MNPQVRCAILKRVVYILDYLWFLLVGGGLFYLGAEETGRSLLLFLLSGICFVGSWELGYIVQHLIIRLELRNEEVGREKAKVKRQKETS